MTRILKTLLGRRAKTPAPEEVEALERAQFVLSCRVARLAGKAAAEAPAKKAA